MLNVARVVVARQQASAMQTQAVHPRQQSLTAEKRSLLAADIARKKQSKPPPPSVEPQRRPGNSGIKQEEEAARCRSPQRKQRSRP